MSERNIHKPSDHYRGTTVLLERSFTDYVNVLELSEAALQGKFLDIGSGLELSFAKGAKEQGIAVTSLNPELEFRGNRERARYRRNIFDKLLGRKKQLPAVAAIAQALPFQDESFDQITCLLSVPHYLPNDKQEVGKTFEEMKRVLKPGGGMSILYWVESPDEIEKDRLVQEQLAVMQEAGYVVNQTEKVFEGLKAKLLKITKP